MSTCTWKGEREAAKMESEQDGVKGDSHSKNTEEAATAFAKREHVDVQLNCQTSVLPSLTIPLGCDRSLVLIGWMWNVGCPKAKRLPYTLTRPYTWRRWMKKRNKEATECSKNASLLLHRIAHTHIKKKSSLLFQYKHRYNFIIMMYDVWMWIRKAPGDTPRHGYVQSLTEHNAEMPL